MKAKSTIALCTFILVAVGLSYLAYFGINLNLPNLQIDQQGLFSVKNIKQGLDLQGGVTIVYEAEKGDPTPDEMVSALSLMQGRLDRKGWTEAEVAQQGSNRIRVDIPGVEDTQTAVDEIGKTAQLMFADETGAVLLTGSDVKNASKEVLSANQTDPGKSNIQVLLEFTPEGQKKFSEATGNNIGKPLYILLDDEVISAPIVNSKIDGGSAVIQGTFTSDEAEELSALIRAGALPFNLTVLSTSKVGARLGADALSSSLMAGAIGLGIIILLMIFLYKVAGLAADLALIIYVGLQLIVLSLFGVTLTLPGIAGIILSIGMAVDANIIIFERIKDELRNGKTMRVSLQAGFKRAFPAIFDSNVTTIMAAIVLYWLGTGPVKGFAQTLIIGIVISMFTALTVTRLIIKNIMGIGVSNSGLFGAK